MIYLQLFYEFLKIGLFTIGGGMATLPLLTDLGARTGWFDQSFITEMVAISESTPGPIGINMATYVGYNLGGVLGGIVASLGVALLPLVISLIVARFIIKFKESRYVEAAFYGVRPAVIALIFTALITLFTTVFLNTDLIGSGVSLTHIISFPKLIYFVAIFFCIYKFKLHPIIYIAISAVVGILIF